MRTPREEAIVLLDVCPGGELYDESDVARVGAAIERARADGIAAGVAEALACHGSPHMSAARDLCVSRQAMAAALVEYER